VTVNGNRLDQSNKRFKIHLAALNPLKSGSSFVP